MTDRQRIDKWLWHARFARTRSAAQDLVRSGVVRVNRIKTDAASHVVKVGDVLTVALSHQVRVIRIVAIAERRGPATAAAALYDEAAAPLPLAEAAQAARPAPAARPEKRDRRRIQALKRSATAGSDL